MVREVLGQSVADKLKTIPPSSGTIARHIEDLSGNFNDRPQPMSKPTLAMLHSLHKQRTVSTLWMCIWCSGPWPGNTVWESQLMALLPWLRTFRCVEVLERPPNALVFYTKSHWWLRIWCLCLMKPWTMYKKGWTAVNGVPRTTAAFQICVKTLVLSTWRCCVTLKYAGCQEKKPVSREYNSPCAELFNDKIRLIWVAYFADVFNHINTLNVSMQGKGHNVFEQSDKMYTFKKRSHCVFMKRWTGYVSKCLLGKRAAAQKTDLKKLKAHLTKLKAWFDTLVKS